MTILCNLFLIALVAISVSIFPLWVSSHNLLGADRVAGPVVFFFLSVLRWIGLSVALIYCATHGAFTNSGRGGVAAALVIAFSVLEILTLVLVSEGASGHAAWLDNLTVLMSVAMPLPLACYFFWWLDFRIDEPLSWLRWVAIGCSASFAVLGLAVNTAGDRVESQNQKDAVYVAAKYLESRTAEFRRMRLDDAGDDVGRWLVFTRPGEPEPVRAEALASIATRPNLVSELARCMLYVNLYDAGDAARYLGEMKPAPDELGEPFRQYSGHVVEGMHNELAAGELDKYFSEGAEAAVIGARTLPNVDVRRELQQMAELLRTRNSERTRAAVAAIDAYLAAQR
jgi:hypothetical protein